MAAAVRLLPLRDLDSQNRRECCIGAVMPGGGGSVVPSGAAMSGGGSCSAQRLPLKIDYRTLFTKYLENGIMESSNRGRRDKKWMVLN